MKTVDLSGLPSYKFSHHSLTWWGINGMMAIEGTVFALAVATYFYIWSQARTWPFDPPPLLLWGSLNVLVLLASVWPNQWTKRAAEDGNEAKMRIGLVIGSVFGVVLIAIRAVEFGFLNCRWDSDAYGSALWLLLGLHTVHLVTDVYDTWVLTVLMFTGPVEGKRHVDVSENALYWYFVVISWIPIYAVIYWAPRLLEK